VIKTITADDLKQRLSHGDVLLVDVREPIEYNTESINGSVLIPLAEVSLEKLPSKSKPIVAHCRSGKRSMEACKKLLAQDPNLELYNLEGGILAWKEAGYPIQKTGFKS